MNPHRKNAKMKVRKPPKNLWNIDMNFKWAEYSQSIVSCSIGDTSLHDFYIMTLSAVYWPTNWWMSWANKWKLDIFRRGCFWGNMHGLASFSIISLTNGENAANQPIPLNQHVRFIKTLKCVFVSLSKLAQAFRDWFCFPSMSVCPPF